MSHIEDLGINKIHVVGDSHSLFFNGWNGTQKKYDPPVHNSNFIVHHLGPCLAYNMDKFNRTTKGREQFDKIIEGLGKSDYVLLCFGEIDIRSHLFKLKAGERYVEKFRNLLAAYQHFINLYKDRVNLIIYGPIATQKDSCPMHPTYPRYSTEKMRNLYTLYFNLQMKQYADKNNLFFFTVFPYLIDENFNTREENLSDRAHLSSSIYGLVVDLFFNNFKTYLLDKERSGSVTA